MKSSVQIMCSWTVIHMTFVIHIVVSSVYCHQDNNLNLVSNGNFVTNTDWTLHQQENMWVFRPGDASNIYIDTHTNHLSFQRKGSRPSCILASQYISLDETPKKGLLKFTFSTTGRPEDFSKLQVIVDISYLDGRHMSVEVSPKKGQTTEITCIVIPAYGTVRAIMVHIMLKEETLKPFSVDYIKLNFINNAFDDHCELYDKTYPFQRQVMPDFLPASIKERPHDFDIAIVTQLTMDRLDQLDKIARAWQGPISAAILIVEEDIPKAVQDLVNYFHQKTHLQQFVSVHLVLPDMINVKDSELYPVNFLRNTAIRLAGDQYKYVFLVDADITPGFTEEQARQWVKNAIDVTSCEKCAFVAPLVQSQESQFEMPKDKATLVKLLEDETSIFKTIKLTSHSAVRYPLWKTATQPYKIPYVEDMEPYFILDRQAPLMNEIYAGYGRDKCAYSRDVYRAGYTFWVLNEAFIVNRKDIGRQNTIYSRSKGVQTRMHLNIAFHKKDLENGYLIFTKNPNTSGAKLETNVENSCGTNIENSDRENIYTKELNSPENSTGDRRGDKRINGKNCESMLRNVRSVDELQFLPLLKGESLLREDTIAENLLRAYSVGPLILVHKPAQTLLTLYAPYAHPDGILTITPENKPYRHSVDGVFEEYSGGELIDLFSQAREDHPGPALIWLYTSDIPKHDQKKYLQVIIESSHVDDILFIAANDISEPFKSLQGICRKHSWEVTRTNLGLVLKSPDLPVFASPNVPALEYKGNGQCKGSDITTDLIVATKNRPLQMLAFLQSLSDNVKGLHKVWIIYKAEDPIFYKGYERVKECIGSRLNIQLVDDSHKGFGQTFLDVLNKMEAKYVILGVDEMVWLGPIDLSVATCALHTTQAGSFQFRLGKNMGNYDRLPNIKERVKQVNRAGKISIPGADDINLIYPYRLPYDFGYVTNVDGTMMRVNDIKADLKDHLPRMEHPGHFENRWIRKGLHTRCRQWHLMFERNRLVNNVLSTDGRVIGKPGPLDGSFELTDVLLKQHKQLDYRELVEKKNHHRTSHVRLPLGYMALQCT